MIHLTKAHIPRDFRRRAFWVALKGKLYKIADLLEPAGRRGESSNNN
jgi:hypothetical protein